MVFYPRTKILALPHLVIVNDIINKMVTLLLSKLGYFDYSVWPSLVDTGTASLSRLSSIPVFEYLGLK